ncbi:MAG TPA: FAD-dependent oxidoreductase [Streptosporangiaceae bacterium]|jgi:D-amino-acid oxidase|nr:FAD-dependent oxidoreductase [Streptosporangiaceae bacterium]
MSLAAAPDVLVVGAGVAGLTTAICLAETGLTVRVRTDRLPPDTTSAVAGAIWGPHLVENSERTARWRRDTLAVLRELAGDPATGVRIASGIDAARTGTAEPHGPEDWLAELGGAQRCEPAGLPPGFSSGWRYTAPLAHMPTYLGYLRSRLERAGGTLETGTVTSLPDAARAAGAVVNCTGVHARDLAGDPDLAPVRGQTVIAANPGLTSFFIGQPGAGHELVYLFPHGDTVVLGGTQVAGDWHTAPVPEVASRILRDCASVEPRLRDPVVLGHRVGLRPVRPTVRLEAARDGAGGPLIVHNYGHGGAGVTLSWGCARAAAALVTG